MSNPITSSLPSLPNLTIPIAQVQKSIPSLAGILPGAGDVASLSGLLPAFGTVPGLFSSISSGDIGGIISGAGSLFQNDPTVSGAISGVESLFTDGVGDLVSGVESLFN